MIVKLFFCKSFLLFIFRKMFKMFKVCFQTEKNIFRDKKDNLTSDLISILSGYNRIYLWY